MKKLLAIAIVLTALLPVAAFAKPAHKPVNNCLVPGYAAVYGYPTGSYWAVQIAAYPAYYAAHNAFYLSHYGC